MRRARRTAAAAILLAAGCTRNLELPAANAITVTPAAITLAPRQTQLLAASGGAGGFTFGFADGGALSGPDATIVPATGLYRAGSLGQAQDVVVVTDASGRTAEARITVGPRLAATPPVAVTAPGGDVVITGSGGRPPYQFSLVGAQVGSQILPAPDGLSATYRAGPLGDLLEKVSLRDGTYDAADPSCPAAEVEIRLSAAVSLYANTTGEAAPFETIEFLAVGGQPPYTFGFANGVAGVPPSGGSIDLSGRYRAGAVGAADGTVFDDVTVQDGLGQMAAPIRVRVGAPLALALADPRLSPDVEAQLVATGGKPPYAFAFAPRGNRSNGTVESATGVYTPGGSQGTSDILALYDATGIASATVTGPPIGFREVTVGSFSRRALAARLRGALVPGSTAGSGTPIQDVVDFLYAFQNLVGVTSVLFTAVNDPAVEMGYSPLAEGQPFATDLDLDAQDEIVVFRSGSLVVFDPDLTGGLAFDQEIAIPALAGAYTAVADPTSRTRFFTTVSCGGGLVDVDLARAPPVNGCVTTAIPSGGPLVAADLDGDGLTDLATVSGGSVHVGYGNGGGGFDAVAPVALPAGCSNVYLGSPLNPAALVAATPASLTDRIPRLHVSLGCTSGGPTTSSLGRVDGTTRTLAWDPAQPVDLGRPGALPRLGAYGPTTARASIVATWDLTSSTVTATSVDGATVERFDPLPGPLLAGIQWIAFPDVNGDTIPDLFAVQMSGDAAYMLGDGDGRFGRRPRFGGINNAAAADVDGDGVEDVIASAGGEDVAVLFGGDHQLSRGPSTPMLSGVSNLAVGDFGGSGLQIMVQERTGTFRRVEVLPDGTLGAQQPITTSSQYIGILGGLRAAHLGGGPSQDVWAPYATSPNPSFAVLLLDTPSTGRYFTRSAPLPGCALAPVGPGDASVPADFAAACVSGNDLVIYRSVWGPSAYGSWSVVTTLAGTAGTAARVTFAGRDAAGQAYFVGAPAGAPSRNLLRIAVSPGATRADPLVVATQVLGAADAIPGSSALLGDVDRDGTLDLLLSEEARGVVMKGTAGAGPLTFGSATPFRAVANGAMATVGQFGASGGDLLVRQSGYMLLRNVGGLALE